MVEYSGVLRVCMHQNFLSKIKSWKNPPLATGRTTVIFMMLLLCGDVEVNPGPRKAPEIFPCGCCEIKVDWGQKAVCCDDCSLWYHKSCISMRSTTYDNLSSASWHCFKCHSPIRDSFTFHSYNVSTRNSFNPLLTINDDFDCDVFEKSVKSDTESSLGNAPKYSSPQSVNFRHTSQFSNVSSITTDSVSDANNSTFQPSIKNTNNLRLAVMNTNSVRYRKSEMEEFTQYAKPDLILMTETKLTDSIKSSEFLPSNYHGNIRKDRTGDGGGVLIAYKDGLDVDELNVCENKTESVWAKVTIKGEAPVIVGSFYRQDSESSLEQIEELDKILSFIDETENKEASCTVILGGDFNLPDINWELPAAKPGGRRKNISEKLIETTCEHNLEQVQREATRLDNNLDLVFINKPSLIKEMSLVPGPSDHATVITDTFLHIKPNKKQPRNIHQWSRANWDLIKNEAKLFADSYLEEAPSLSVNQRYSKLTSFLEELISKHVPQKLKSTRRNVPWMTRKLHRLCRKKQRLFNKAKKNHSPRVWEDYRSLQRRITSALRKARIDYINNILVDSLEAKDNKTLFRFLKSQGQENCGVSSLKHDGILHQDSKEKAEILNKKFSSAFTSDDSDTFADTVLEGPSLPPISNIFINENGVFKMLSKLDVKKAGGPDLLPCKLLRELAEELAPIFTDIFQNSLDTGELPAVWGTANVAPIYKKGAVSDPGNYRPVSLTCIPCKLLEHIVVSHMRGHFDKYGVLTPLNHGFRAKHSCETQLLMTIHDLQTKSNKVGSQIDVAVLDFSKAFDKVPHARLMSKLRLMGITGNIAVWIKSFLGDRSQRVVVDGCASGSAPVKSGVPQGTVLGPLLFLCYINDLPSVVDPGTQVRLFADDCLVYRVIHSVQDQLQFQSDLDSLSRWGQSWGMQFNTKKCNILTISNRRETLSKFYQIEGNVLANVDIATYLGVLINKSLSFSDHIQGTVSKANKKLGFLKRNLKRCPSAMKKTAYLSLVRSGLEYSAAIWDPYHDSEVKAIEMVQNRAIRWIHGIGPRERCSISELRAQLKLDTLESRRHQLRLSLFYKIVHRDVAVTTKDLGIEKADRRSRANHKHKYREKGGRTDGLKFSMVHRTIPAWNRLPAAVAEAGSIDIFKSQLSALCP